ncbi:hypothetical protein ACHAPT_012921 [Fusarium lateritium]
MASHQVATSFLHLPLEIRNVIYDLALVPVEHGSILNPTGTAYTKKAAPLLYVHPSITADLGHRLYRDDFSIVLPIQEPGEFARGRGLSEETLQKCLDGSSKLMKQRCQTLVIEACQTSHVMTEWDPEDYPDQKEEDFEPEGDYEYWESDEFATKLVSYLLRVKKELPALKTVKFIFWLVEWEAPLDGWKEQLEVLAREWVKLDKAPKNENSHMAAVEIQDENVGKTYHDFHFQVNTFDYYDQDAGDGGMNWIQVWSEFADGDADDDDSSKGESALNLDFVAMDLKWDDHIAGRFGGWQFNPEGWENPYINTMPEWKMNRELHCGSHTCRPMYVQTTAGDQKEKRN